MDPYTALLLASVGTGILGGIAADKNRSSMIASQEEDRRQAAKLNAIEARYSWGLNTNYQPMPTVQRGSRTGNVIGGFVGGAQVGASILGAAAAFKGKPSTFEAAQAVDPNIGTSIYGGDGNIPLAQEASSFASPWQQPPTRGPAQFQGPTQPLPYEPSSFMQRTGPFYGNKRQPLSPMSNPWMGLGQGGGGFY